MMTIADFTLMSFASLFVITDPIGLIPTFLTMTESHSPARRIHTARLACLATCLILLSCQIAGEWVFKLFGITLPAFEIAGGVILLLVALDMVRAQRTPVKETKEEEIEGIEKDDVAITPMAVPMLAGPGAITTVILLANRAQNFTYQAVLAGTILIVGFLSFLILRAAARQSVLVSKIALKVASRLMGLLLTAIAIQFILNGLGGAHLLK